MKLCTWHLARPRRWLTTTTYRPLTPTPLQPKHIPRNHSRRIRQYPYLKHARHQQICQQNTGSVSFFSQNFYPWMVLTRDQPRRQTWRDTRIPRSRRTLVSTLYSSIVLPNLSLPKASAMAKKAPHSSSNTSKILKQLSRMNPPIHRSIASSTWMCSFGSGTSFLNRVTDAVVSVLRCTVLGWCSPPEVLTNGEFASVDKGVRVLTVYKALEWRSLPEGPKVVDVGGGVGTSSLRIARAFSNVK